MTEDKIATDGPTEGRVGPGPLPRAWQLMPLPTDLLNILHAEARVSGRSVHEIICGLVEDHIVETRSKLIADIGRDANRRFASVLDGLAEL